MKHSKHIGAYKTAKAQKKSGQTKIRRMLPMQNLIQGIEFLNRELNRSGVSRPKRGGK